MSRVGETRILDYLNFSTPEWDNGSYIQYLILKQCRRWHIIIFLEAIVFNSSHSCSLVILGWGWRAKINFGGHVYFKLIPITACASSETGE